MAIKGTATIELTNADGSKETIKHDNMITNAVNDLCLSQRGEMAAILKMVNQNDSYAQAMFGGLLLFDEVLTEDASDYQIPTTKITGYASQDAYAGLDLSRGSFNASEGGVQADGSYKFVWDFSTSQANGTIKSLGLCPNVMGKIGASDTIVDSERKNFTIEKAPTEPFDSYGRMLDSNGGYTAGISNWCHNIVAIVGDIAYGIDYYNLHYESNYSSRHIKNNGGVLKLYKFKLGTTSISLADRVGMARYIETINVQLPTALISALYQSTSTSDFLGYSFDHVSNRLIVFPTYLDSDVAVNGTVPYVEIELTNNMNVISCTFTNTTPDKIRKDGVNSAGDSNGEYSFYIIKDYIIVVSGLNGGNRDNKLYIINKSDNTNVKVVTLGGNALGMVYRFDPAFVAEKTFVFGYSWNSSYDYYIVDLTTGIAKKTNATELYTQGIIDFGNKTVQVNTGSNLRYYIKINPFILTTKNNLDSPVVKTASQTMKITYTLSEVAESGV